jgi:hypothetical protein
MKPRTRVVQNQSVSITTDGSNVEATRRLTVVLPEPEGPEMMTIEPGMPGN